jgi:hypothetical protein
MIQTVARGEHFAHRHVSLHKRIHGGEPATTWLTITAPWKATVYDLATDSEVRRHPRYCFGLRFWGPV